MQNEFDDLGRLWFRDLLSAEDVRELAQHADVDDKPGARLPAGQDLLRLVGPGSSIAAAIGTLGVDEVPVRIVAFNKTRAANWSVPWHQDRAIAVAGRLNVGGYSNWVAKDGFWHCEPPISLLDTMVFVRIHLDETTERNGPLLIARGSHRLGAVPAHEAAGIASRCETEACYANAGDVLAVHALTLHRSGSAEAPSARRTLRVDYARRRMLAPELNWAIGY